jgi:hypothetical protein
MTLQTNEGHHCDNHINTILLVFKWSTKDTQMDTHTKFTVYLGSADGQGTFRYGPFGY